MPDTTVTQPGWEIREHQRDDGTTQLVASIDGEPVWVAQELIEPISGYRWNLFSYRADAPPGVLVWSESEARAWLEHEAQNALLAAKVVAA